MQTAPQPTRYGTYCHLPERKPTINRAMKLLELTTKPRDRQQLRDRMTGWRHGSDGPWGAGCSSSEEAAAIYQCHDAYIWLRAQLPVS